MHCASISRVLLSALFKRIHTILLQWPWCFQPTWGSPQLPTTSRCRRAAWLSCLVWCQETTSASAGHGTQCCTACWLVAKINFLDIGDFRVENKWNEKDEEVNRNSSYDAIKSSKDFYNKMCFELMCKCKKQQNVKMCWYQWFEYLQFWFWRLIVLHSIALTRINTWIKTVLLHKLLHTLG